MCVCFLSLQVNVIHTANPVEHANNAMVQPNFINPVHHASVDLSGHNLANAHQASGTTGYDIRLIYKNITPLHVSFYDICRTFVFSKLYLTFI